MKKTYILILLVLVIILGLVFVSSASEYDVLPSYNKTTFNVSSEGPINLSTVVSDIKNYSYFEGYDRDTLTWMESLGDKYVYHSAEEIVIMDKWEANKIPSAYVCDASFWEIFEAEVIESHSLGDDLADVYYVKHVNYLYEQITYYDV